MHNILDKFIEGIYNLNIILGNKKGTYDKVGLGYQHESNIKSFKKFFHANMSCNCNIPKYTYCGKNDHIFSSSFLHKNHDSNMKWNSNSSPNFLNKNHENGMNWTPRNIFYFNNAR